LPICDLSLSTDRVKTFAEAGRLFHAYNDILGPVITNVAYSDASLLDLTRRMHVGSLRHPGGTVANFWSMANGTYTVPCDFELVPLFGNHCKYAQQIANNGLPPNAFTPNEFVTGVASVLQPAASRFNLTGVPLPVVFNMNVLTLGQEDILAQIDLLSALPVPHNRPLMIELGNELYIGIAYGLVIPNASVYIERIKPLVHKIRSTLPTAWIAAVSNPSDPDWDTTLAAALRLEPRLFDAVTIHDYNCEVDVSTTGGREQLALYGPVTAAQLATHVLSTFGTNTSIWMTEFNIGPFAWSVLTSLNMTYSVLHSLFAINFGIAAACDVSTGWDVLMLHMLWQQAGMASSPLIWLDGWGVAQLPNASMSHADALKHTWWTTMAQLSARFGYYALSGLFQRTVCLNPSPASCQHSTFVGANVSCVRGAVFEHRQKPYDKDVDLVAAAVITHACETPKVINVSVALSIVLNATLHDAHVFTYVDGPATGTGISRLADCPSPQQLWACGPATPTVSKLKVVTGAQYVIAEVPLLSVSFVEITYRFKG